MPQDSLQGVTPRGTSLCAQPEHEKLPFLLIHPADKGWEQKKKKGGKPAVRKYNKQNKAAGEDTVSRQGWHGESLCRDGFGPHS